VEVTVLQQEAIKEHSMKMRMDRPNLNGLILEHMSVESQDEVAQEADYEVWHLATNPEKLWQATVKMHKVDCASNALQAKELTTKKASQNIKQGTFKSLAQ